MIIIIIIIIRNSNFTSIFSSFTHSPDFSDIESKSTTSAVGKDGQETDLAPTFLKAPDASSVASATGPNRLLVIKLKRFGMLVTRGAGSLSPLLGVFL